MSAPETLLAFDVGTRRVGVAVGNTLLRVATPLAVLPAAGALDRIAELIAEWTPQRLIVGLPAHADGTATHGTAPARTFARRLEARTRLPVAFVDERYTSVEAEREARETRRRPVQAAGGYAKMPPVDDLAAALILQQYLDAHPPAA